MKSLAGFLRFLIFSLVVLAGFVFAARNSTPVGLWMFADFSARPFGLWLLLAFASGALLGILLAQGLWWRLRAQRRIQRMQAEARAARLQIADLRQQLETKALNCGRESK